MQFAKSSRLVQAGHAWRADGSLVQMVMVNKIDRKRPRERQMQRLAVVKKYREELKLDWIGNSAIVYAREVQGGLFFRNKEPKWFVKA